MNEPIRVMVVDDSAVFRGLLVTSLENTCEIEVVATAMHGEAALKQLSVQPVDVVILDVEMPVMDGLTALPHILREYPDTRVVMASAFTREGADATVRALALGASACVAKPVADRASEGIEKLASELIPLVKALGPTRELTLTLTPYCVLPSPRFRGIRMSPEIIVIGSSTGGPNALSQVLTDLSSEITCPILIVQHMPPGFTTSLARHLEKDCGRPTQEAVHGGRIESGCVYVAPGNFHLVIDQANNHLITTLNQNAPEHYVRPSVNPLFFSAAAWYGRQTLAVMLTGMGNDGLEGTREIVRRGGTVIAQDQESSVVWGMPGAIANEGLAQEVLPLTEIGAAITRHCLREVTVQ